MPVIGSVKSVALTGKREAGTVFQPNAKVAKDIVKDVVSANAAEAAATNARLAQLEGTISQLTGLLERLTAAPVVAEPLTIESAKELTPQEKAAITRAEKKAAQEADTQAE